jgi:hypothetical protein
MVGRGRCADLDGGKKKLHWSGWRREEKATPIWIEEGRGRCALDLERRRTSVAGWRSGGEERTRSILRGGPRRRFFSSPTLSATCYTGQELSPSATCLTGRGVVYICNSDYQPCWCSWREHWSRCHIRSTRSYSNEPTTGQGYLRCVSAFVNQVTSSCMDG